MSNVKKGYWYNSSKIKIKEVGENIRGIPTQQIVTQCSNCKHCFMMISEKHYKYCPNCAAEMESRDVKKVRVIPNDR